MGKTIGVVHGRFQPLHNGHLFEYILPAKKLCDILYIGITNPDPSALVPNDAAPHRSEIENNPFTYREREIMIRNTLIENNIPRDEFIIVPFPIHTPDNIKHYVPQDAIFFMTIFDKRGEEKRKLLEYVGLNVRVLTTATLEEKSMCSTDIRTLIKEGKSRESIVPPAVYNFIQHHS